MRVCEKCGGPHQAKGLCMSCYDKARWSTEARRTYVNNWAKEHPDKIKETKERYDTNQRFYIGDRTFRKIRGW